MDTKMILLICIHFKELIVNIIIISNWQQTSPIANIANRMVLSYFHMELSTSKKILTSTPSPLKKRKKILTKETSYSRSDVQQRVIKVANDGLLLYKTGYYN